MNPNEMKAMVLARMPAIRSSRKIPPPEEESSSIGRIISQSASAKLLAGVALFLLVTAVGTAWFNRGGQTRDASLLGTSDDVAEAWGVQPTPPPTETNPLSPAPVAETSPAKAASAELPKPETPPARVHQDSPIFLEAKTGTAPVETSMMSSWPHPDHPIASSDATPPASEGEANQAMAVRPPEYTRNPHEHSRSSIY